MEPLRRPYQESVLDEFTASTNRCWALLWERQAGKSTALTDFALYEMFKHQNRTVIYASASLLLAQEITLKTAVRANQTVQQMIENDASSLKQFADTAQSTIDAQKKIKTQWQAFRERLYQHCHEYQHKDQDTRALNVEFL